MADEDDLLEQEDQEQTGQEAEEGLAERESADPALEAEARKYGWRPKDDYDLAPEGWVDASRFLELPKTQKKIISDQKAELEKELAQLRDEQKRIGGTVKAALDQQRRDAEERHQREITRIRQEMRSAAESGDVGRFDELQRYEQDLKPPQQQQSGVDPALLEDNAWLTDQELYRAAYMAIEGNPIVKTMAPARQIAWARDQVAKFYPDKFPAAEDRQETQQERPQVRQRVDSGGLASGQPARREKGWDEMPPAAKASAQEFFEEGQFGYKDDPRSAKRRFAELYWQQGV